MKTKVIGLSSKIAKPKLSALMYEKIGVLLDRYDIKVEMTSRKGAYGIYDKQTGEKIGGAMLGYKSFREKFIDVPYFYPQLNHLGIANENKYLSTAAFHLFLQHYVKAQDLPEGTEIKISRVSGENYDKFYSKLSEYSISIENSSQFGIFREMNLRASFRDLGVDEFVARVEILDQGEY